MGWVESPPYFCAASEMGRDMAVEYIETTVGGLPAHKFEWWSDTLLAPIGDTGSMQPPLWYVLKVYVNDFISAIIPTTWKQIEHVTRGILHGIHNVFPPSGDEDCNPISLKKLRKGDGKYDTTKCLLGFEFNGVTKTIWLEEPKWVTLLTILHKWIQGSTRAGCGIPFAEFKSVIA
jgi:hypothetical protein